MSNLERITNRLEPLSAQLKKEGKDANQRVVMAVEDCLLTTIDDKLRASLYAACRTTATLHGYADYLPKSGQRDANNALSPAFTAIKDSITSFVVAGLTHNPDALVYLFRKKNKENIIYYTEETLVDFLYNSTTRRLEDDFKNKVWDGQLESLTTNYESHINETNETVQEDN